MKGDAPFRLLHRLKAWERAGGVELLLETGERAFAFFGAIPLNTEVLCTVLRKPTPGRLLLVSVDAQDCLVA